MTNNNLIQLKEALYINLSHHLFNGSGFRIIKNLYHNELYFMMDLTGKSDSISTIFTVYEENNAFELLPTDDHKNIIPSFKTSDIEDLIYYINNKFNLPLINLIKIKNIPQ